MRVEDVRAATQEAATATEAIAAHLLRLRDRLAMHFPLQAAALEGWDDDPRERLHAMLRLFEQLYDLVSRRLLRGFLTLSEEDPRDLSARNMFRRAEALMALDSADRWIEIGKTRNALVHDYPANPTEQARRANEAWREIDDLTAAARYVIRALHRENLL